MILPNKYLELSESLIGLSALIIEIIGESFYSIDKIWLEFSNKYIKSKKIKKTPTYQKFIYAIEFMYISGMISYNEEGEIYNENIRDEYI